ncbi:organic cation transporter protein-like isoform X1 [Ostrea edulis]|uniref:organic cation transporter protein-like isoform X1 n=1 Tax=Ostrea edulis TaxID=37623 RepID=UPI0024AFEEB4|nr:organic cation transporter protein-like isoform X1 [Ostrea edulis]
MKFDDILQDVGEFGKYQKFVYFLLCLPSFACGLFMMHLVFVMETPNHRCKIADYPGDTYDIQSLDHQRAVDISIPRDFIGTYEKCSFYSYAANQTAIMYNGTIREENFTIGVNATLQTCSTWVYERSVFKETYTSEHNLVCDDAILVSHSRMIFYFGVLVGDLLFGWSSDKMGRKTTMYVGGLLLIAAAFAVSWAPEIISFTVLEFIIGGTNHGSFLCANVLGQELVGPSKRKYTGTIQHMFFSIGLVYQTIVYYFSRDWQISCIVLATSCLVVLPLWWLVPESPRWLISQGRNEEANVILQKIAKVNGTKVSPDVVRNLTIKKEKTGSFKDLLKSKTMCIRAIILCFNWMAVCLMYYGVTINAGNIGDFYLNFFLMGIVEFPGILTTIALIDRIGRKKLHLLCMMVGGVACLCTIFTVSFARETLRPLTITLAAIGKMASSAAFVCVFIFTVELFPTVIRNIALGGGSCFARIGSMMAPYCVALGMTIGGSIGEALPLVIFGAASVTAGLMCLYLPETLNQKLPETIEDGINFGRGKATLVMDVNGKDETERELVGDNAENDEL